MKLVRHPLVARDLIALADHIVEVTGGDLGAAVRRLDEVDLLLERIIANPLSGMRLGPPLEGWLVRHGGSDQRLTIVFRLNQSTDELLVALVAFGGQDWIALGESRSWPAT